MVKGPLPLPYPENFIERADFQRKSSTNAFCFTMSLREATVFVAPWQSPERVPCEKGAEVRL